MRLSSFALRLAIAAAVTAPMARASAQRDEKTSPFKWSSQVASGRWVNVNNVNGRITVGATSGSMVEVTAVKRWTTGNPDDVRIEAKKDGEDVVICALYKDQTTCNDDHHGSRRGRRWNDRWSNDDDDVVVDFTVLIPRGTKITAGAVNGAVVVTGATSDAEISSVNGEVRVETGAGPLRATTVNGSVHAKLTGESVNTPMTFSTVNGGVFVEVPGNFGADVTMTTVNGSLQTDFPMTMQGRIDPHHMTVHVGAPGGPRITLTTVNGDLELRKR